MSRAIAIQIVLGLAPLSMAANAATDTRLPALDAQHHLSHVELDAQSGVRGVLGDRWRHRFELLLTREADRYAILDEQGYWHQFKSSLHDIGLATREMGRKHSAQRSLASYESDRHTPNGPIASQLEVAPGGMATWYRANGSTIQFTGSLPTRVALADESTFELHYHHGRLTHITESSGDRRLSFTYDAGRLVEVRDVLGQYWRYRQGHNGDLLIHPVDGDGASQADDERLAYRALPLDSAANPAVPGECPPEASDDKEQSCDTAAHPPPPDFGQPSPYTGGVRIDLRPSSCASYFTDFPGRARGRAIERALADNAHTAGFASTHFGFPLVDFAEAGELRIVQSRDLTAPSWSADGGRRLYQRLLRDARAITENLLRPLREQGSLQLDTLDGHSVIQAGDIEDVVLELIIRHDTATSAQQAELEAARLALWRDFAITLRIVEIP